MRQVITGRWAGTTTTSPHTVSLFGVADFRGFSTDLIDGSATVIPATGTLTNFRVAIDTSAAGNVDFTFTNFTTSTSVIVTIPAGSLTASSSSTLAVTAGNQVQLTRDSGVASIKHKWSYEFQGTNPNEAILCGGNSNQNEPGNFFPIGNSASGGTEPNRRFYCPTSGTIKSVYAGTDGSGAKNYVLTLYKNGSLESSATIDLQTGARSATGLSISFVAGDTLTFNVDVTGVANSKISWGIMYNPTIDGESMYGGMSTATLASTQGTVEYNKVICFGQATTNINFSSTESDKQTISNPTSWILKKFRVNLATAPGASQTRTLRLRKDSSNTTLTATISGTSTSASDNSNQVLVEDQDLLSFSHEVVSSGVNANVLTAWSWVGFIDPGGAAPFATISSYNAGTNGKLIVAPQSNTAVTGTLDMTGLTDNREYDFPDRSGVVALASDIGGSNTEILFNDGGVAEGDPDFTW